MCWRACPTTLRIAGRMAMAFCCMSIWASPTAAIRSPRTATDWPIARDVVDFLGEDMPEEDDDDSMPSGDLDMLEIFGIDSFELEAIASDYDVDSDEQVATIAAKLKIQREFEAALATLDD